MPKILRKWLSHTCINMWVVVNKSYTFVKLCISTIYSNRSIYLASSPLKIPPKRMQHTNYFKYVNTYFVTSAPLTRNHIRIGTHCVRHIISRKINTRVLTSARAHTNCAGSPAQPNCRAERGALNGLNENDWEISWSGWGEGPLLNWSAVWTVSQQTN